MTSRGTKALQVENLIMDFQGLRALDDVTLTLEPGEILGLIGPNGSGKTTTINIITGFLAPTRGVVKIDGRELTGRPPHTVARANVRRTFQTIRLFKNLTVLENVVAAGISAGQKRREAERQTETLLESFGIAHLAKTHAGTLPYGAERRVEIARALVASPRYLLLDEPAAGMNEAESTRLLTSLRDLVQRYGCGLLIIDHNMRLIMRLCDRLHVLSYGRTIAEGAPREVRHHPDVISAYLGSTT